MLFKALIERLLGSSEAQDWKEQDRAKTSRFSYDNYPSLLGILSDLLDPAGPIKQTLENSSESSNPFDLHGAEGVFPALQILRQARPPTTELGPIRASVQKLLASPHWHMRDMAARTVVSLLPSNEIYDAAFDMLRMNHESTNTRHGVLLAVKYMMRKLANDQFSPGMSHQPGYSDTSLTFYSLPRYRSSTARAYQLRRRMVHPQHMPVHRHRLLRHRQHVRSVHSSTKGVRVCSGGMDTAHWINRDWSRV